MLHLHGAKFKNVPEFHLSTVKRSDGRSILTQLEMEDVAASMFEAARAGFPFTKVDKNVAIIDILTWRQKKNRAGGRAFVKLSQAANTVLNKGKINGRWFWRKFYTQFPMLKVKQVKETSVERAKQCSQKVATDHIEAIKLALAKLGIYDLANDCFFPGKAGNIIWLDECGNFFNYNLRRGTSRLVTGIKGCQAKTAMSENRGSFTIDAALGGDGYLYHPHILFAQDGMTSDMLPENTKEYKWMSLSNNAFGVQTGSTFLPR